MARYDSEGYRSDGRRQILGYSRAVQGGADEARARATMRREEAYNPALKAANQRARNVMLSKARGDFNEIRDRYNQEAEDVEMDRQGNIKKKTPILQQENQYAPPKKPIARATPLTYMRPASQNIADTVGMTSGGGLLDLAQRARRRGTYVIQ
jgi:hypothetical protein